MRFAHERPLVLRSRRIRRRLRERSNTPQAALGEGAELEGVARSDNMGACRPAAR